MAEDPQTTTPETELPPTPGELESIGLDWLSSHPHWQAWRLRRLVLVAAVLLPLFVGSVLYLAFRVGGGAGLVAVSGWLFLGGMCLAALLCGAILTLGVMHRLGVAKADLPPSLDVGLGDAVSSREAWFLIPALAFAMLGPLVLAGLTSLPFEVRFLAHFGAVMPFLVLILGLWRLEQIGKRVRRKLPLLVLAVVLTALLCLTLAHDLAQVFQATVLHGTLKRIIPFYSRIEVLFIGPVISGFCAFLAWALWWFWASTATPPAQPSPAEEGLDGKEDEGPEYPLWVAELLATLPDGCRTVPGKWPQPLSAARASPHITECTPDLDLLFGGSIPTERQLAALVRFRTNYDEACAAALGSGSQRDLSAADLLLEGEAGSGRSTTVAACAAYAALVRGQGVLVLEPDVHRRACAVARLQALLARGGLDRSVGVAPLSQGNLASWLPLAGSPGRGGVPGQDTGPADGDRPALPYIVVATLADAEALLYGNPSVPGPLLARFLALLEVVTIDDFPDFPEVERAHLPLFLAKHRLLLESGYGLTQFLVSCPPVAAITRDQFLRGLFAASGGARDGANWVSLLPRPSLPAWLVRLEAEKVAETVEALVCRCLENHIDALLYRKGIDDTQRQEQVRSILNRVKPVDTLGKLTVIASLDDPLGHDDTPEAAFFQAAVGEDMCLALHLRGNREGTVVFAVHPCGEAHAAVPAERVAFVVDRSAFPLVAAHVASVWRLLPAGQPIPLPLWQQLGLDVETATVSADTLQGRPLYLDSLDPRTEPLALQAWPYLVPLDAGATAQPVSLEYLWVPGARLCASIDDRHLLALSSAASHADSGQSLGRWVDSTGQDLGLEDLARLAELRHPRGSLVYAAESVYAEPGRFCLAAIPFRGNGEDLRWPRLALSWQFPSDGHARRLWGGRHFGLACYSAGAPGTSTVCCQMLGHFDDYGREQPIDDVSFSYPASLSFVVIAPGRDTASQQAARLVARTWDTAKDAAFLPALTAALNYALDLHIPGVGYYARCVAFAATGQAEELGGAIVWIVEPANTGFTVLNALRQVLREDAGRGLLFESAHWVLAELRAKPESRAATVRRLTRLDFGRTIGDGEIARALGWVSGILARRARAQAGGTQFLPDVPAGTRDPESFDTEPAVDLPSPEWDPAAQETPWAECLALLRPAAEAGQDGFGAADVAGGRLEWRLLVDIHHLASEARRQLMGLPCRGSGLDAQSHGNGIGLGPGVRMTGDRYWEALAACLQGIPGTVTPNGQTVVLTLWAKVRSPGPAPKSPLPGDPVFAVVAGGLRAGGLQLARRPDATPIGRQPATTPHPWLVPSERWPWVPDKDKAQPLAARWSTWDADAPRVLDAALGAPVTWRFGRDAFSCSWGFQVRESRRRFLDALNAPRTRISTAHFPYLLNDPYLDAVHDLAEHLATLSKGVAPGTPELAQFLLAFVQALPYVKDPSADGDWPRFPSECLLNGGGDCEDSSLLFSCLLAHFGYDFALLSMPSHMAVGLAGPFSGSHYVYNGTRYYYAETATHATAIPLGVAVTPLGNAKVLPFPGGQLPAQAPVQILNGRVDFGQPAQLSLRLLCQRPSLDDLWVSCLGRPGFDEFPSEEESWIHCGCVRLDAKGRSGLADLEMPLDNSALGAGDYSYDVVVHDGEAAPVGRWYSLSRFTRSIG